ncbi:GYF domain-containing protein [Bacillus sp. EB01]|uniref:GYF domain-containing protein n=1 Tax=Bacillus sp. EB01 TaxID=1347086 RepID=UPI0005C697BF|nr:GYF domain-containing protein [Bacillus sp. EB01]
MAVETDIIEICRRYSGVDFYIGDDIPPKKLANAMINLPIPDSDKVLALVNCRVFGSCKKAIAIGMHGFYWHTTGTHRITWRKFLEMGPMTPKIGEVVFRTGFSCILGGSSMKSHALMALLEDIRYYFRESGLEVDRPVLSDEPAGSIDLEGIRRICEDFSGPSYYVAELIPAKKLEAARENYSIPDSDEVIALVDATVFGSAKNGLAICTGGLYWDNDWTIVSHKNSVSWNEFRTATIQIKGKWELEIGEGCVFGMSGSQMKNEELCSLLMEIQSLFALEPEEKTTLQDPAKEEWHLAANGQRFGPYDRSTVERLAETGQIHVGETLVWKKGRNDWSPLLEEEIFAKLAVSSTSSPPPLPVRENRDVETLFEEPQESVFSIDINKATLDELICLPGMTLNSAKLIIQERERRGGIRSLEELGVLLSLKPHVVEKLKPLVWFSSLPIEVKAGRIVDF